MASPEHGEIADVINRISTYAGHDESTFDALQRAADAYHSSVEHHEDGNYERAHKDLQIAAEHIGTAASLGAYASDPYFGYSMHPKAIASQHVQSYKHAYLS